MLCKAMKQLTPCPPLWAIHFCNLHNLYPKESKLVLQEKNQGILYRILLTFRASIHSTPMKTLLMISPSRKNLSENLRISWRTVLEETSNRIFKISKVALHGKLTLILLVYNPRKFLCWGRTQQQHKCYWQPDVQ